MLFISALNNNPLTQIDADAFATLSSLKILSLRECKLTSLDKNIFVHQTSLQSLFVGRCRERKINVPQET